MLHALSGLIVLVVGASALFGQTSNVPAPPQSGGILLVGATAHLGDGQVIRNSAIGFEGGKLTLVAEASAIGAERNRYPRVVDVSGKRIYPGFILPATETGLVEVSSLADTDDAGETANLFTPGVRALVAYNTDSEVIPTLRFNGILTVQSTPSGGVISGLSSIMQLDAWTWEDAAYLPDDGVHLRWPARYSNPRWWMGETEVRPNPEYEKTVREITKWLADAGAYRQTEQPESSNLGLAAMGGLFDGSRTLFIHADLARDILESVRLARQQGVTRVVLVGAAEVLLVRDFVIENRIPVVLDAIHAVPRRDHEDTVDPYKRAAALHEAGIEFCIGYRISPTRVRNLPFTVGTAIGHGLPYEEGVKAVTGSTARILGIADRVGTLAVGKDATLFVSTGDAFDMRTNHVELAFIQGREIQREGRQQELYRKYTDRYGQPR